MFLTKKRNVLALTGLISLLIISCSYFYFSYEENTIHAETNNQLKAIASLKISQIVNWNKERLSDAKVFSQGPFFINGLEKWLGSKSNISIRSEIMKKIALINADNTYRNIMITDAKGNLLLSLEHKQKQIDATTKGFVKEAIKARKIINTDLYLCQLHNKIHLDYIAPVLGNNNKVIATIIFRVDPNDYLYPLIKTWPTPSKTAETLILRKEKNGALYLNELTHQKNTALKLCIPLTRKEVPAVQAVLGYKGIFEGVSYHGSKVLAYISPVPGTPWVMIAQEDDNEIYADLYFREKVIISFTILLVLALSAGFIWYYHYRQRNIYRELFVKEKELREYYQEFRTILYSIGDGVITTDTNGNIKQMNRMSEELTGWSETEVIGKPIERIFNIINEGTRNVVENPVHKVLKEGVVVGLANHTLLISKDGKEIPIADSGAPIRDELGKIEGVVLVFRDKTTEYKVEKLIRQSEARLKRAELTSKSGNWELHLDSQIIVASEGAAKIYGVDWNEMEFEVVKKVALPEYRHIMDLALKNLIEKDELYDIEFKIRTVDTGEIKDIHSVANYDRRNRILFGVIQDITDRKEAETALIESEEKMRMIIEGTPYFFFYTQDSEANITYISPSVETITGYTVDRWIGQKHWYATDSESNELAKDKTRAHLRGEFLDETILVEIKHANGNKILLEVYEYPIVKNDAVVGLQGIAHDITERKNAEQTIHLLAEAVRSTSDCISLTDTCNNILFVNESFLKTYGYEENELIGQNIELVRAPSDPEPTPEVIKNATLHNGWFGELLNIKKDGTEFPISLSTSSVLNDKGEPYALIGITRDITDYKKAEQELQKYREHLEELVETRTEELDRLNADLMAQLQKEKELEMMLKQSLDKEKELNELKTRFISTTSHEFRTPLTSVLSSAELIQRYGKKWNEEKQDAYLNKIKKSVDYLTKLLDDVLTISRTESGKILFNPDMVDLHQLCAEIIEEAKSNINERNNFVFNYSMEKIKYSLDSKLIKFILTNLLSNAFKYSPEGGKVELSITSIKDWIQISVADEGIGIPDEDVKHLFEPFHRAANTTEIPGTGLGLSIVKHAVDLHKGKINIQSKLGKGTAVTVEIPQRQYEKNISY